MLSTAPDSADHPFTRKYIPDAVQEKKYFVCSGPDDPNWTKANDDAMAQSMGGRKTPAYRREILCELISDTSKLIIPEFVAQDQVQDSGDVTNPLIHERWKRPSHYTAYVVSDFGGSLDYNGILCGFLDFPNKKLVIEREAFVRDINTEELSEIWKATEAEEFGVRPEGEKIVDIDRWADSGQQRLIDLSQIHDLTIRKAPKHDAYENRNLLRTNFSLGRISINARCTNLIYQLRNGTIDHKGVFLRTDRLGHCDLVASLIYMNRVTDFDRNPFPSMKYSRETHFTPPRRKVGAGWDKYFSGAKRW
jgi:hypothetical protein